MRVVAKVSLEHGDSGGREVKYHSMRDVAVDFIADAKGVPQLSLAVKPKELLIPIAPPLSIYSNCLAQGRLGLRFMRYKQNHWDRAEKTLQVSILVDPDAISDLVRLRDGIDKTLRSGKWGTHGTADPKHRRPLAPKVLNSGGGSAFCVAGRMQPLAHPAGQDRTAANDEDLPPLSSEQQRALDLVLRGKSIFFTGCAGTGKSLLLRHIVRNLPQESTFVTGTTGLAGSLLGGTTTNAFAGIGLADPRSVDFEALTRRVGKGESGARWRKASTLIIDEISMMDAAMFDMLEALARRIRGNQRPFGGIRVILSGDFHQLPPVADDASRRRFAFEAESWGRCVQECVLLTQVFRQRDVEFITVLDQVRVGTISEATLRTLLSSCSRPLHLDDGILPTRLYTHREDVEAINQRELAALEGDCFVFNGMDTGDGATLQAACPAPRTLRLKIGAQVMLTRNLAPKKGLVNGARGVVERFTSGSKLPVVRFASGNLVTVGRERHVISAGGHAKAVRSQIPLALAWAITVHKSQGLSLDRVEVSLDRAFEAGMAYVALSRARSLDGLRITGTIARTALQADPKVLKFYESLRSGNSPL